MYLFEHFSEKEIADWPLMFKPTSLYLVTKKLKSLTLEITYIHKICCG